MANKKLNKFLLLIISFVFLSCSYKESFHDKIYIFYRNCTDLQVELKMVWSNKKNTSSFVPERNLKWKIYRFWFKDPPHSCQVILLYKGEAIETVALNFPEEGLYSYCAYGGLYTRINILLDDNGPPYMEISSDLDP